MNAQAFVRSGERASRTLAATDRRRHETPITLPRNSRIQAVRLFLRPAIRVSAPVPLRD
jgi:hypothetical protein